MPKKARLAGITVRGEFFFVARNPKVSNFYLACGGLRPKIDWEEHFDNQVMNAAINDWLEVGFNAGTQKLQWYIAPINASPSPSIVAGDTASSHAGWAEATTYTETERQDYDPAIASKVMTNAASVATITANGAVTVYGGFVISDDTKGGSTGVLLAAGQFTGGSQVLANGRVLDMVYQLTVAN